MPELEPAQLLLIRNMSLGKRENQVILSRHNNLAPACVITLLKKETMKIFERIEQIIAHPQTVDMLEGLMYRHVTTGLSLPYHDLQRKASQLKPLFEAYSKRHGTNIFSEKHKPPIKSGRSGFKRIRD